MAPSSNSHTTKLARVVLAGYWSCLFISTHIANFSPPTLAPNDKWSHFLGYAGLGFLLPLNVRGVRFVTLHGSSRLFGLIAAYGAFDELTQLLVPGRSAEGLDWAAGLAGGASGLTAARLLTLVWKKRVGKRE